MLSFCKKTSLFLCAGPSRINILFWAFLFFGIGVGFGQSDISIDSPAPVLEGDGPGVSTIDFTVTIDASDPVADITVDYLISGGNEDTDTGTLTFLANTATLTQTVSVTTNGDTVVESDEPVSVTLSNASANANISTAVGNSSFTDDDISDISIDSPAPVAEGNGPGVSTIDFTVSIDQSDPDNSITVDYLISGGNEDTDTGTLTFLAGTVTLTQTVSVTTNGDTVVESDEPVSVTLSNESANASISTAVGNSSFTDDDISDISIDSPAPVAEGNGPGVSTIDFIVSIDQSDPDNSITVDYEISGGNEDTDTGTLTFLAGTVTLTQTVSVTTNGDTVVESDEPVSVTLSNASANANISTAVGNSSFTDDDISDISIDSPAPVAEGNGPGVSTIDFTVTIDASDPVADITVDYLISGGNEDTDTGTLTFLAGTVTLTQTVSVTTNGDTVVESDEPVSVTLSNASANANISTAVGNSSFTDDDISDISIDSPAPVAEGNGPGVSTIDFTVTIDASDPLADITVDYLISGGNEDTDTGTLTFLAGTVTLTQTVSVTTNGDTVVESDEPVSVTLSNESANANISTAVGNSSFTNDDSATLTITNESVAEDVVGGNLVFTVTLDNVVAGGTQVAYSFTNGTAGGTDYDNTPNTLTFVGNASETQDIIVPITDDTIIELDETFTVNLGVPSNGGVAVSGSPATGTITNDDTAVATITASDDTAEEQGLDPGAFTVNIGGVNNTGSPITVDYNVGGTATPGSDYATLSGSVDIINGQQNGIITVTPIDDTEIEADETIVVTLVAGAGYTVGAPNSDTVTLVSEDNTPPDGYTLTINQDPINITNETAVSFTMTNLPAFSTTYEFSFSSSGDGNVSTVTGSGALSFMNQTVSNIDVSSLPDGVVTLSVVVSNLLGTEGPPTTDTAVKYTAVPSGYTATIDQSIINFDNQTSINFTFAGAEVGADYDYTFTSDGGGTPVNGSGTIATPTDNIANIDLSSLADGLVTLSVTLTNVNGTGVAAEDTSNKDTSVCNAGGGAPVLDATEPTVFCGDFLVDLNDYVTNVAPVGSTLTWSTNPDPNQTDGHRNSMVSSAAQYFGFFYDEVNACASPILTVTLTNFPIPVIIDPTGDERCGEGTLTLTASSDSGVLSWYDVPTGGTALDTGGVFITPSISETTSFYVEATANGCTTERIEVIATVLDAPSPGTATDTVACNSESEDGPNSIDLDDTLSGADAGTWAVITDPSNGSVAIGAGNVVDFANLAIGDYVFEYTTTGPAGPCENSSVQVTVTVEDCFANADIDLVLTKEVDNVGPLLDDIITFTITLENTTMDRVLDIVVTDLLDEAFEYVGDDATLGTYDPNTGEWTIPDLASDVATATLEITVRVTELGTFSNTAVLTSSLPVDDVTNNNTATVSVTVGRDQCTDPGTLCTIFSPNNDGVNDRLKFVDPNGDYTNNRLEIFDRYGNSVFAMDGYDSSWDGTGKNGAVPKGTYFYILDLHGDGAEVVKGWIQIIR